MCGIFGILLHDGETVPDERRLTETARLLSHRGPDSSGIFSGAGMGLAHTRLSLLDLNSGRSAFRDRDGRYCLVYNWEIYNFKELREELELSGTGFRTTSDTEVLLEWLINRGAEATLPRLEGMFAFALYDRVERSLLLARDRFGIKPLFVYDGDDAFVFSSEVLRMKPVKLEPDDFSISSFLFANPASGFGGPSKGHSFFKGVKFLPPGAMVRVQPGMQAQYGKFSSIVDFLNEDISDRLQRLRPLQLVNETEELLFDSVRQQMVADAPVGALCSGGVDSSVIMAMAARCHNNLAVFHANVMGRLSEYSAAAALARHLKLDLKAVEVNDEDFIDMLPEVVSHFGHPFCHMPHSVPFLQVSKLVRETGVKAVLSGEGSDECYLGYSFLAPDIHRWRQYSKDLLKMLIRKIKEIPSSTNGIPIPHGTSISL
jgi:asparagine synthase (glutamine-hydrolysing)